MNAVKRCLALVAATLVVGACSGDPTADLAGTDLTIRVTPGAVWMQQDKTTTVTVEVIDATGSPQPGSWTATTTGPLVADLDEDFQETNGGAPVGNAAQFVISATAEGEGSVTFAGTGGPITVPVRVAPATTAFHVTITPLNPAIAENLTITAPAGIRFTSTTTVTFVRSATNTANNGLAAPSIVSMTADSTQMVVLPAPGGAGRLQIAGVASVGTPTLKSTAISVDSVTVPVLLSVGATPSNAAPAVNTAITLTMPTNFKYRPTSTIVGGAGAISAIIQSISADSLVATILPPPGAAPVSISAIRFSPIPSLSITLPTTASITVANAPDMGDDDPFGPGGDATLPQLAAPTAVGTATGFYDAPSFTGPDYVGNGGFGTSQAYIITFANAGTYNLTLSWDNGSDLDLYLVDAGFNSIIGQSFLGNGIDESINLTVTAGSQIYAMPFRFAGTQPANMRIQVRRTS